MCMLKTETVLPNKTTTCQTAYVGCTVRTPAQAAASGLGQANKPEATDPSATVNTVIDASNRRISRRIGGDEPAGVSTTEGSS